MGSNWTAPAQRGCSDSALCHPPSLLGCSLPEFRGHQPKISAHPCQQAVSSFNQQNTRHRKGYRKSPKQMGQNITGATEVCDLPGTDREVVGGKCVCRSFVSNSLRPPGLYSLQAPLSMGFSRQEYQSGQPCPPPGDLPDPGIKLASLPSPALAGRFFPNSTTWVAEVGTIMMPIFAEK